MQKSLAEFIVMDTLEPVLRAAPDP
jgi:hypothetical protein